MAQTNMGMTSPFYSQINMSNPVDDTPKLNIVTKQIWVDGEGWVTIKFYHVPNLGGQINTTQLERWCMDNLGKPKYLGKWCKLSESIVLDDKSYMLWLLVK